VLTALTRAVSSRVNECELTFIERAPINFDQAVHQHQNYQELLRSLGVSVTQIAAQDDCPDCCFLEDTALVLDELAVITRPGSEARRREVEGGVPTIRNYRNQIVAIEPPAIL